ARRQLIKQGPPRKQVRRSPDGVTSIVVVRTASPTSDKTINDIKIKINFPPAQEWADDTGLVGVGGGVVVIGISARRRHLIIGVDVAGSPSLHAQLIADVHVDTLGLGAIEARV
ncbi:hypothetical protein FOZ63_016992, partial [Perkinsus olseni]